MSRSLEASLCGLHILLHYFINDVEFLAHRLCEVTAFTSFCFAEPPALIFDSGWEQKSFSGATFEVGQLIVIALDIAIFKFSFNVVAWHETFFFHHFGGLKHGCYFFCLANFFTFDFIISQQSFALLLLLIQYLYVVQLVSFGSDHPLTAVTLINSRYLFEHTQIK